MRTGLNDKGRNIDEVNWKLRAGGLLNELNHQKRKKNNDFCNHQRN